MNVRTPDPYPGWLSDWGDPGFQQDTFEPTLQRLLATGRSFNLYVVHGGTNFGLTSSGGSRMDGSDFSSVTTSYDYAAPINEHGAPTPAYHRFRELIGQHLHRRLPEVPATPPIAGFDPVVAKPVASLWDLLPSPRKVHQPRSNEELFGQNQGMVLYRKRVRGRRLQLAGVHDYATVFADGKYLDYASRIDKPDLHTAGSFALDGQERTLDLLIDSFGHIGFAQQRGDRKGLVGSAQLDGRTLLDWDVDSLPLGAALPQRMGEAPRPPAPASRNRAWPRSRRPRRARTWTSISRPSTSCAPRAPSTCRRSACWPSRTSVSPRWTRIP